MGHVDAVNECVMDLLVEYPAITKLKEKTRKMVRRRGEQGEKGDHPQWDNGLHAHRPSTTAGVHVAVDRERVIAIVRVHGVSSTLGVSCRLHLGTVSRMES